MAQQPMTVSVMRGGSAPVDVNLPGTEHSSTHSGMGAQRAGSVATVATGVTDATMGSVLSGPAGSDVHNMSGTPHAAAAAAAFSSCQTIDASELVLRKLIGRGAYGQVRVLAVYDRSINKGLAWPPVLLLCPCCENWVRRLPRSDNRSTQPEQLRSPWGAVPALCLNCF